MVHSVPRIYAQPSKQDWKKSCSLKYIQRAFLRFSVTGLLIVRLFLWCWLGDLHCLEILTLLDLDLNRLDEWREIWGVLISNVRDSTITDERASAL